LYASFVTRPQWVSTLWQRWEGLSLAALCCPQYLLDVIHAMQLLGERQHSTSRAYALDEVVTGEYGAAIAFPV
jgi:hypothetical protein